MDTGDPQGHEVSRKWQDLLNSHVGQAAPEFLELFPENPVLASWMGRVRQSCLVSRWSESVEAAFLLQRISGKKFQKIGLASQHGQSTRSAEAARLTSDQ
jgi:hypothetical protein